MLRPVPRLEPRLQPSRAMFYAAPLIAILLTLAAGAMLFAALGKPPLEALALIFIAPLSTLRGLAELTVKATPLILIAIGLAAGFRGGIWNIGAEGQFTVGALAGGDEVVVVLEREDADQRAQRDEGEQEQPGTNARPPGRPPLRWPPELPQDSERHHAG